MKIFFDTEFIEDGSTIAPISLGFCTLDGQQLYIEIAEYDVPWERASPWVVENVRPHLGQVDDAVVVSRAKAGEVVLGWVSTLTPSPEFWAWFSAYDWVLLCQLFGTMMDLPSGWPKFCNDLRQLVGGVRLPRQEGGEHHALADALWVRDSYKWYAARYKVESLGLAPAPSPPSELNELQQQLARGFNEVRPHAYKAKRKHYQVLCEICDRHASDPVHHQGSI